MAFTILTLMENHTGRDYLACEHGLSLLVEGAGRRVLYDTGGSPRFLQNAGTLGADLADLDAVVFSHGHYDHTGGAAALLMQNRPPRGVWLGRNFFQPRVGKEEDGLMDISPLLEESWMTRFGIPCHVVGEEPVKLAEGMWLISGFTQGEPVETPSPRLLRRRNGHLEVDTFEEEVALVLKTPAHLVLVSGCSHVGVLNMCRRVEELFGRTVTDFVGGTHLMNAGDERIEATCRLLKERGVRRLGACHCSGERASAYFEANFPGFFRNNVGTRVVIED